MNNDQVNIRTKNEPCKQKFRPVSNVVLRAELN